MRSSEDILAELKTLHPQLIDLSLGRIETLLAKLGRPQDRLPPVVHVAGTNGKGSFTAFLKAMLEAAGKRVHTYTSPHLVRFHERIELAGADGRARPIAEGELVERLLQVERINAGAPITFFEITTAAAFLAFAEHPADALILEVGLGGRLDATNVVARPALSVIMPVSLDHMDKLGSTLEQIAFEKAGILKSRVPAVISAQPPEALEVIADVARRLGAPLSVWGQDFEAFEQRGRMVFQSSERLIDLPLPALMGQHQIANAGTAVAAALQLKSLAIGTDAIERGLLTARWPARMQQLSNGPLSRLLAPGSELWLDGGHNVAGGRAIAQTLAELEERAPKPVVLVLGMMGQKDARGFVEQFRGLVRRIVTVPVPGGPEATHEPEKARGACRLGRLQRGARPRRRDRDPPLAGAGGPAAAHPDLRLALSRRPSAGAAGGRAAANELSAKPRDLALTNSYESALAFELDRALDPVLELLLLHQRADALSGHLAVLEDHQGRHRLDAILLGGVRVLIDVELHHLHLALHLGGHLLERRRHGLAGAAPLGVEIHEHRLGRLQHLLIEGGICYSLGCSSAHDQPPAPPGFISGTDK